MKRILFLIVFFGVNFAWGQTTYDWLDTAPDNNWNQGAGGARWSGGFWDLPTFGILQFNNNHQTSMNNNNSTTYNTHQIVFGSSATSNRVITGAGVRLFDNGGNDPKIVNNSIGSHTISINIEGDGDSGDPLELNPILGNLTFENVNNQGSDVNIYGNNNKTITFNGSISGNGSFAIKQNSDVYFKAVNTYEGNTYLEAGKLIFGIANAVSSNSNFQFKNTTLNTGGFSQNLGHLTLQTGNSNSTIVLGTGSHTLRFAAGSPSWNDGTITIENWDNGTNGKIYFGTSASLTTAQLNKIIFTGFDSGATQKPDGEVIPRCKWIVSGWVNGYTPTADTEAIIDYNYSTSSNGVFTVKKLTVNDGKILTVNNGTTLTIVNEFINNGDGTNIIFENNASLLQTNNGANTGNITYTRNSTSMKQLDFTYWSSPVAGEFLDAITNTDKLYGYNTSVNYWTHLNLGGTPAASTLAMEVGKGYATRNPNVGPITQVGTFVGVPNNGDITVTNIAGASGNSVFLGNPYPSAIDLELFHTSTNATNLNTTYYFWTHNSVYNGTTYSGSDYANYNTFLNAGVLGGTQYVAAGQGFFVDKSTASTISVEFKNSHRVSGNNSGFFRMAQNQTNSSTATVASDKIWFNLISPSQNILKQTLLAYAETASNGYDSIDALTYDGQPALDFYTLIPSYKFVIQARAWEFVDTDVVNIGYRTANAGTFQLVIDHFDPIWNTRSIVLKDNLLNMYHNIKESAYTFTSEVGTFDSRFEIIYQTNALSNPDVSFDKAVIVFAKDKNIHINSGLETIKEVVVYDLQGRIITTKTNMNATQIVLENLKTQTQVLLVKVTSTEGKITTKKVVF